MRQRTKQPQRRGPSRFRKTEATRLVRAALDAGLSVARVECDPASGRITVVPGKADEANVTNEWDEIENVRAKSEVG